MDKITTEMRDKLREPLPPEAVSQHPTKSYLSSIKSIYVVERINDVFGLGSWTLKSEVIERLEKFVVVKAILEIPGVGFYGEAYGGNDNSDIGDAYKGATTDGLTKIAAQQLEIGIDVFKGLPSNKPPQATKSKSSPVKEKSSSEHWCQDHNTAFFMRGRMISYAHPIEGTDPKEWCHEPSKTKKNQAEADETEEPGPEEAPQTTALAKPIPSQPEPAKEKKGFIDMDWLKESQQILKWTDKTMATWLVSKYKVKGGLLEEVIAQLTKEQQKEFVQEIQDRREMS